jgi:hypothetical protein
MIYYHDFPEVVWSAGCSIDWRRGNTAHTGIGERDGGQFGIEPREVEFVTGCALLARRKVLEQVGLLDERFFAYYEEAEWCLRTARAGYKILHVPQSKVWHKISPSAREASPLVQYYMIRNRLLFLREARAGLRAWVHTLCAEYLPTLVSWSIKPKWRKKRPQRDAMVKAIHDYFFNKFGCATGLQHRKLF